MTLAAGPASGGVWAHLVGQYAWAMWLAAPAIGIVLVSLAVWWWSRPARPATTPQSIAGHHAYLDALARPPRERVVPAPTASPEPDPDVVPLVDPVDDAVDEPETEPVPEGVVTVRS